MASNEPPDAEGSGRPPISSFDVPIDESGADEVEQKREARKNEAALPSVVVEALKLKGLGFSVMPLPTDKKYPPPAEWEKAVVNNPAVFLRNPGTHNYAILPPPGVFGWDVDKEAPALLEQLEASIGVRLPETLVTLTPNGRHVFYRWPAEPISRPKGAMFGGIVTRWPLGDPGQGYLVGPGSVVVQENGSLGVYRSWSWDDDEPIADLPTEWVLAALGYKPAREVKAAAGPLAVVGPHYELPESVPAGGRYDAIRDYVASQYNRGLSKDALWGAMCAELAPRFSEALTTAQLRERFERTVRSIEERLGPPAVSASTDYVSVHSAPVAQGDATGAESDTPRQAPLAGTGEGKVEQLRAVPAAEFVAQLSQRDPISYLVEGWVPGHALTVMAGHPKSMKSLAVLQMLGAFVAGDEWLGRAVSTAGAVNVGIYLTREGSVSEMLARTQALVVRHGAALGSRLRFVYEEPVDFTAAQYDRVAAMLAELESEMSVLPGQLRVMLVLDPLRDLMPDGGDENEAKTMAVVKRWCRSLIADFGFLSIVLVHHLRKSANGSTGLEMSGSGAMYGAVDSTIVWKAKKDDMPEEDSDTLVFVGEMYGTYRVETRGDAPFSGRWRWDAVETRIVTGVGRQENAAGRALPGTGRAAVIDVLRGVGLNGASTKTVSEMAEVSEDNVRKQLNRLRDDGRAVKEAGYWYADGFAPFQQPDVVLPLTSEEAAPAADDGRDDEVWTDPLHRLD